MSTSNAILLVLTGHDQLGDTGRKTGYYVPEAAHPWRVFTDAGYRVDVLVPGTGTPQPDGADLSDPIQQEFADDADMAAKVAKPLRVNDVDPAAYRAIFFVGGHGTMWDFPGDTGLAQIAADIYESGGVVSAVCHGPAGLVDVRLSDGGYLVDGKQLTSFTNAEEEAVDLAKTVPFLLQTALQDRGAQHHGAANFTANVVSDGRLVTGQNPASARGAAETVVNILAESKHSRLAA